MPQKINLSQYIAVDKLVKKLNPKDYEIDEKDRNILLTNEGINNVEKIFSECRHSQK